MWGDIAITFLLAFITTYVFTPYSIRLARKVKALDIPKDKRKIHKKIMPRLGGIAIVAGFLVSAIYLIIAMIIEKRLDIFTNNYYIKLIGFFLGILVLEAFCYFDDTKGIKPIVKLIGQIIAATIVVASGVVIDKILETSPTSVLANEIFLKSIYCILDCRNYKCNKLIRWFRWSFFWSFSNIIYLFNVYIYIKLITSYFNNICNCSCWLITWLLAF